MSTAVPPPSPPGPLPAHGSPQPPAGPGRRELTPEESRRLAARYPVKRSRLGPALVGLLLVGSLAVWGVWAGWVKSHPGVHGQLYSYQVVSDTRVDVKIDVHRPDPARGATCTVQAQAPSGETVGEIDVVVPAGDQNDVRLPASLKTYLRAHTAVLTGCHVS